MSHRDLFEALKLTLMDRDELFGSILILLFGDFRQFLPIVSKGKIGSLFHA